MLLVTALVLGGLPLAQPAYSWPATREGNKDLTFYFHYASSAQTAGGVSTNYLADTSATFQNVKNHDTKAVGQPKIQVDFYVYPALAGQVQLTGDWQVIIFANSTALHPATWNLEFWEKSPSGTIVWDSGALTPTVVGGPSGNNGHIDVPVYGYTLTAAGLTHTFSAGDTLEVEVTVNTGATVPLSVWYDSAQQPSRMILPSNDYMLISGISTEDANGTARTVFFTFWRASQRNVTILASVTDPLGGYDIHSVLVSIKDPTGSYVVTNQTMQKVLGTSLSFDNRYSYTFHYDSHAPRGNYSLTILALDNNAQNQFVKTGSYYPYAQLATSMFSIGIQYPVHVNVVDTHKVPLKEAKVAFFSGQVQYAAGYTGSNGTYNVTLFSGDFTVKVWWEGVQVLSQNVTVKGITRLDLTAAVYYPTFEFVDDVGKPVAGALVFMHFPNGSAPVLPYTAGAQGSFALTQQPKGTYSMVVLFEGVEVADTSVPVASDGPFTISTRVFQLRVTVEDSGSSPLNGTSVLVSSPGKANGGAYGFLLTGTKGEANFSLPEGTYVVTAEFHGVYLLSPFSNRTRVAVTLDHDTQLLIRMKNLPPPVWLTLGFQLVAAIVVVAIAVGLYVLLSRRRKAAP